MPTRSSPILVRLATGAFISLAIGIGGYALWQLETMTESPGAFQWNLADQTRIEPQHIGYRQVEEFATHVALPHCIVTGPDDRIYVAGEGAVQVLEANGQPAARIELSDVKPTCLAVGGLNHSRPGCLYVGDERSIHLYDVANGQRTGGWDQFDAKTHFTAMSASGSDLIAADAGHHAVLVLDSSGQVRHKIGDSHNGENAPGFIIPSFYFDVVADADGRIHAVNPGARRIETYAATGELETAWGRAGSNLESFFGCCNPSHLARLPDGRFVTSEKGLPRVKVYGGDGAFQTVVAGPEQLGVPAHALGDARTDTQHYVFDIATDSNGRILVLDPAHQTVRVFVAVTGQEKNHD